MVSIVKDFVQDSSLDFEHLRCDPHKNPSQKRGIRAHFQSGFYLKIIISGHRPFLNKISSKISCRRQLKKATEHTDSS